MLFSSLLIIIFICDNFDFFTGFNLPFFFFQLHPMSDKRRAWDLIILGISLLMAASVPLNIAFGLPNPFYLFAAILYICDIGVIQQCILKIIIKKVFFIKFSFSLLLLFNILFLLSLFVQVKLCHILFLSLLFYFILFVINVLLL